MKGAYIITYVGKGVNMKYYYLTAIKEDVKDYINDEITISDYSDRDELESYLNDELWNCDSVTGNASGSYYCNSYKAESAVAHNWDMLADALTEFGETDINPIEKGAEWCDVTIRCYLLSSAISEVLDSMEQNNELVFDSDNE